MSTASNVLLIMSDEHRRDVMGAYGNAVAHTPNLDTLAGRGIRFDNAYCNFPICVPSRASFVTGRYAHTIGAWDNATPYQGTEAPSWGHRAGRGGCHVTTIGKLHFRSRDDDTGFADQRLPLHVTAGIGDLFGCLKDPVPRSRNYLDNARRASTGDSEYLRYDAAIADMAVNWLRHEAITRQEPWCLWVSFVLPHPPFVCPTEYAELIPVDEIPDPIQGDATLWPDHPHIEAYRTARIQDPDEQMTAKEIREARRIYYGMCAYMDAQVGRVLEALDSSGQADHTRVIYVSDHGEMLGDFGLWGKNNMYEPSAAVPLLMAGPDLATRVVDTPVSLVDLYPTILEALGLPADRDDMDVPGTSLLEIAGDDVPRSRPVLAEYHASGYERAVFMWRRDDLKYVHHVGHRPQLFDLASDPDERHDLAGEPLYADRLIALERELRAAVNPDAVECTAKLDQRRRIDGYGGADALRVSGPSFTHTRAPDRFHQPN